MRGKFCVFEGIDGSGKTTLAESLSSLWVERGGISYLYYGVVNKEIKKLIKAEYINPDGVDETYLSLLYAADRTKNSSKIKDLVLKENVLVIYDRYFFSSLVYQPLNSDLSISWIETINKYCIEPDKIVYIDISVEEAMNRILKRGDLDFYETKIMLQRAKENYDFVLKKYKGKILVVNGEEPIDILKEKIYNFICI